MSYLEESLLELEDLLLACDRPPHPLELCHSLSAEAQTGLTVRRSCKLNISHRGSALRLCLI